MAGVILTDILRLFGVFRGFQHDPFIIKFTIIFNLMILTSIDDHWPDP